MTVKDCMHKLYRVLIYTLFLLFLPLLASAKPKQRVWVIDAGHGGNDHGCETRQTMEKDITLRVAKRVTELIRANMSDVKVVMTREYDKYLTLDQRCVIANSNNAELFLSVHVNAAPEINTIRGTETFYGPQGGTDDKELERLRKQNIQKSELMAWMMQKYYGLAGRPISRGVKRERYYVCLYTKMPAILTEIGFITTPSEEAYMNSKEGTEEIAQCIFRGLKDYDETVAKDKIQSTLAQLRNSGGNMKQNVVPEGKGPEKLTNDNLLAKNDVGSTTAESAAPATQTEVKPQEQAKAQDVAKADAAVVTQGQAQEQTSMPQDQAKDKVLAGTQEPEELDEPLLFSVQIFSLRAKLKLSDPRFLGQKDILVVERDGLYKYLCGTTSDYAGARKLLTKVRETFPDAFLVAYKGARQISMSDAIEMLPDRKK